MGNSLWLLNLVWTSSRCQSPWINLPGAWIITVALHARDPGEAVDLGSGEVFLNFRCLFPCRRPCVGLSVDFISVAKSWINLLGAWNIAVALHAQDPGEEVDSGPVWYSLTSASFRCFDVCSNMLRHPWSFFRVAAVVNPVWTGAEKGLLSWFSFWYTNLASLLEFPWTNTIRCLEWHYSAPRHCEISRFFGRFFFSIRRVWLQLLSVYSRVLSRRCWRVDGTDASEDLLIVLHLSGIYYSWIY
jgi:hypothetical protein